MIKDIFQDGYVISTYHVISSSPHLFQDCAGSILYSTEKAIEVAQEGMQCLGGNGYINGKSDLKLFDWFILVNRSSFPFPGQSSLAYLP